MRIGIAVPDFKQQAFRRFNAERKKEIESDSEKLVQLAADLNSELSVGETKPSIVELRNLDRIQKLAHRVKTRMNFVLAEGRYH